MAMAQVKAAPVSPGPDMLETFSMPEEAETSANALPPWLWNR